MLQKFILTYGIFMMTLAIDFVSKKIAINSATYLKNEGIMMSAFAHLPLMIKSVYLCTIGIFLLAIYILITFYFNFKTKKFYIGAALLFAGIFGNVLDRIQFGYVVDFFQILQFPVFNFADVAQIIGIILVIWSWKTELNFHLPLDNKRTFSPFNRSLDVRFTIQLFVLFLCSTMIVFSFSYLFIKYSLVETGLASSLYLEEHLQAYVIMFSSFIFLMAIVILIISSLISRRIIGPIYAMEKYIDDTLEGKEYPFQLREKDHFRNLESKLTLINKKMKNHE